MYRVEHPTQVIEAEIVDVLVEQIEPGTMVQDPVQTRHFDVNLPALVGRCDFSKKSHRVLDMLKHVTQHHRVS
ncbi:hypothetical protein D3C80_2127120 [compost metagenome]